MTLRRLGRPARAVLLLALTAVACSAATTAFTNLTTLGAHAELRTVDARFQLRDPRPAGEAIAVVRINDDTRRRYDRYIPTLPRLAELIRALDEAGARAIVVDVLYKPRHDPDSERTLFEATRAAGSVVLLTRGDEHVVPTPLGEQRAVPGGYRDYARVHVALADIERTSDGVARSVRRSKRVRVDGTGPVTSMPTAPVAALDAAGLSYDRRLFRNGELIIDYPGPVFRTGEGAHEWRELSRVLEPGADLSWARGRIVLVGATAEVLKDRIRTPVEQDTPGVEVHAAAIETLLRGKAPRELSPGGAWLATTMLVLLVGALARLRWLALGITLGACALVAYGWLAQLLFERELLLVPVVAPLAAGVLMLGAIVAARAAHGMRERRRIAGLFSRYLAPDVVDELVEGRVPLRVGGDRREVTVLFSDIRGFTSISESMDPARLVAELNDYFAEMIQSVESQRGTLDKFIGDGLMAFFGAPIEQPDHADRACAVALDMLTRLDRLNARRREQELGELRIGIGIHSGPAVVGNIGWPARRVDYTAIGDTVNLAARLESATKDLGVTVAVSEATARLATAHRFQELERITVKGREQPVSVYQLTDIADATPVPASRRTAARSSND